MIYPFIFMVFASFKTNEEIFGSSNLLPAIFSWDSFIQGWKGAGQFTFTTFFVNTFILVIPTVFLTAISSVLVSYGFSRFVFPLKKMLFTLMISTLMLPNAIIIIPRYILFNKFGWIDSYAPFIVPAIFACYPFFVFMLVQFFRGIPRELDEAACIDGCSKFKTLISVLLPQLKPAVISVVIFQFIWTWNDFFNALIYINSIKKFPISLALKLSLDTQSDVRWSNIMAMATLSIIPCLLLFFFAQKYFVEGIATTGIKG